MRWNPSLAGHKDFPVQLLEGAFLYGGDTRRELREGAILTEGWGVISGIAVMGPSETPLPNALEVSYFSYAENTFYAGRVGLPQSTLVALFTNGFQHYGDGSTGQYKWLIAGLGGGGEGMLWAAGDQHVHAVTRFKLEEADIPWDTFMTTVTKTRAQFVASGLESFGARAVGSGAAARFERLAQTFAWTPEIMSAGPVGVAKLTYFNGEQEEFNFMRPMEFRDALAAPKTLFLPWSTPEGKGYGAEVAFDEAETLAAFEAIGTDTDGRMRLEIRVSDENRALHFVVRDDTRFVELERARVNTFKRNRN